MGVREVCRAMGHPSYEASVTALLRSFQEKFLATVPAAQRAHTDLEKPAFVTAAFLYCAARNGIFLRAGVVLQRVELQRSDLQHAISLVAQTLALPASPFDRALWKAAVAAKRLPQPINVRNNTSSTNATSSSSSSTKTGDEATEDGAAKKDKEEEGTAKDEAPVSWKESVLQELEARRQRDAAEAAGHEPRRKKMRQTTLLF